MANFSPIPRRMNYGRPSDIKFGPWPRGLVTRYTPEIIDNDSLQRCLNFDVLESGELRTRPGIAYQSSMTALLSGYTPLCDDRTTLASYKAPNSIMIYRPSDTFSFAFTPVGTGITWGVYYRNKFYFGGPVPQTPSTGKIDIYDIKLGTASSTNNGPVLVNATGITYSPIIYKDRLFLRSVSTSGSGRTGGRRVYYSAATNPGDFTGTDAGFIDLPDDVTAFAATRSSLYIFCTNSFYQLTYGNNPTDGSARLDLINPNIGAYTDCAIPYNNHVYFSGPEGAYNLINNNLSNIGQVLLDDRYITQMKLVDERLVCIDQTSNAPVYSLKSLRWSYFDLGVGAVNYSFGAGALIWNGSAWYTFGASFPDFDSNGIAQPIQATCRTKDYDTGILSMDSWKRLYTVIVNLWSYGPSSGNVVAVVQSGYSGGGTSSEVVNVFPANYNINPGYTNYATIKFNSALRVQRWNYDVTIVDSGPNPITLFTVSSTAKVKQPMQSGQVV